MIFFTDLDNTMIYSYKHDIGPDTLDVELYQGRNISFVTAKSHQYLKQVRDKMQVVPVTTRTIEQYERIDLKVGNFEHALVCNGGILLENGKRVDKWYQESLAMIEESVETLHKAIEVLENDARRTFEVRFIEKLFVFTKCDEPEQVVEELKVLLNPSENACEAENTSVVDVFNNGTKVYVVPRILNKGRAVERFVEWKNADSEIIIAAGDSEFDISMLKVADHGLAPDGFTDKYSIDFLVEEMPGDELFSEAVLSRCLSF